MPSVYRVFPLAAASLLTACFIDVQPDLTAGAQSTGATSTTTAEPTTAVETTGAAATSSSTAPATDSAADTTTTTTDGTTAPDDTTSTTGTTTGVSPACEPFAYSTEFAALDPGWTPLSGAWVVKDGFYTNDSLAATASVTWRPGELYSDAVVVLTLEVPKEGRAGLLFRADDDGMTGYYVAIEASEHDVGFGLVIGGDYDQSWSDPGDITPGQLVTLTAVFAGEQLAIELDGQPLAQGLALPEFELGAVGLFTDGTAARFDALHVCEL
jgi:hypothetical protein